METNKEEGSNFNGDRLQNALQILTKCKLAFTQEREECRRIKELNAKLENELKEARELEKSHRYHLSTSREMIGNLQETVSQLVYLKRDMKKLKDEMIVKESAVVALEKEKETIMQKHNESLQELRRAYEKQIEEITAMNERKIQQIQHDSDTQVAQFTCVIEELRAKIKEMETEHCEKMNVVVLEYEEKLQRGAAQLAQMQEQLGRQSVRTDANIDAYRKRLEELEEKLKQSQFKQYLAQNTYGSQTHVERPYSANQDTYSETCSLDLDPVLEIPKPRCPASSQNKAPRTNPLQVTYYGNKNPNLIKSNEKKGQFNISKKRKLYNDKDFQDF